MSRFARRSLGFTLTMLALLPMASGCTPEGSGAYKGPYEREVNLAIPAIEKSAGALHACFGPSADPAVTNFYAEGNIGAVTFIGKGECRQTRSDFPEKGISLFRCHLELLNLPAGYAGGVLTTNTIVSRQTVGETTDPPGYTQASIATVRLWKARGK